MLGNYFLLLDAISVLCFFCLRKNEKSIHFAINNQTIITILVSFILLVLFSVLVPYGYFEEFATLRKIATVDEILYNNLSFKDGDITSYIFIPFYLVIYLISVITSTDVFVAHSLMWGVTAMIFYLCVVEITSIVTGNQKFNYFLSLFVIVGVFYSNIDRSDFLTFLYPTPDRYGFAMGCLLPLAMFHFLIHIKDKNENLGMVVGLIYLNVEIAFVHARESVFILLFLFIFLIISLYCRGFFARETRRTFQVIIFCCLVLLIYKGIALEMNPLLHEYVTEMGQESYINFKDSFNTDLFCGFLINIEKLVLEIVSVEYTVFIFAFSFIMLPYYIISTSKLFPLFFVGCLLLLVSAIGFDFIKSLLGWIIGSVHLFDHAESYILFITFIIFIDLVTRIVSDVSLRRSFSMVFLVLSFAACKLLIQSYYFEVLLFLVVVSYFLSSVVFLLKLNELRRTYIPQYG